jgi:hypothetical protein
MRGYSTISDEERNSILQQHSSFYNGYAVGNVPNEPQPLRVGKGASDPNGITVDNKGNVKTYQNHKINESVVSEEVNEIEVDDMDISDEESAYSFKSDGPEQFDNSYSDDSYGLDIDSIMQMFGGDMSPDEYGDMDDMMNSHMDGKEKFHDEDEAYEFDSEGGDAAVYYEEEQCEGCGSEMMEEKQTCNECGGEMREGECMECGSLYEEIDEDLHESFSENRKQIKEMMNRFNKFN